ncbi:hypothetical protein ACHAQJ_000464 [Trichoderma viride]
MKEATERRVVWEEIDEETFIRFSQYVYTGDYDESEPKKRAQAEAHLKAIRKPKKSVLESPFSTKKKAILWNAFMNRHPLPPGHPSTLSPRINGADDDYTDVFLCHARTYIFADYYGIEALQTLALCKLRQALASFKLYSESYDAINKLVRYCFDHTVEKEEQANGLRSLVCFYAACKVEELWKDTEFQDLTRTLPDFPAGLITAMLGRLA